MNHFGEFFRFDLRYQLGTPILWIGALVFGLLAFGAMSSDSVVIGGAIGNVHRNAPYVIVSFMNSFTILGLFIVTAYMAGALLRDHELNTAELFFATPMRKRDYLLGRYTAGLVASLAIFVVVALAMWLGTKMPWLDAARLGPNRAAPYLWSLFVVVLPNLFFAGALLCMLAALTRSMLGVYLGILAFFVLWSVTGVMTSDLDNEWIVALIDPFGDRALDRATRYWSASERNELLPPLSGVLLFNRALWIAIGVALLAATLRLFQPMRSGTGRGWFRRKRALADEAGAAPAAVVVPKPEQRFGAAAGFAAFRRQFRIDTLGVLRSVPFLVMLAFGLLNLWASVTFADVLFGTKVWPVTHLMLDTMRGSMAFLLVIIVTFYAGELVFKERGARLAEVIDATPMPDLVPLAAKLCALVVVVLVFIAAGIAFCVAWQLIKGFTAIEWGLYLAGGLMTALPFTLMGVLALFLQVITNNKFLGYLLMIAWIAVRITLNVLNFDHNLYDYGAGSPSTYSDMNGFGHFLAPWLWFRGYWSAFAAALVVIAAAFWARGTAVTWASRKAEAKRRLGGGLRWALVAFLATWAGLGGWIFYNTNIVNDYVPGDVQMDAQARYEKEFRKYRDLAQPRIVAARNDVDIFPERREVAIRGHYQLVNRSDTAIAELHVQLNPDIETESLDFAAHELVSEDEDFGYRIYRLAEPMAPGATMDFDFALRVVNRGFTNEGGSTAVVGNGTFFNNAQVLPGFGYNDYVQLVDRNERRKRDLGEMPRMPKLEDEDARVDTYLGDDADWIEFETTVSTSADQVALAPGYLQREWTADGRRYFHYRMDAPMLAFWSWLSARWEVRRERWHDVPIEIYYDRKHPFNVARMVESVKASLDYFTEHFTPYQHRQVRIIEFPRYASFAQSFANTIPFSESIGFIADLRDTEAIDYVFYVTAHEVAHQWWAHQVIGANVQGATVLSESLAQYSALMVMEKAYGRERMRKFLKYELDRYLANRGGELVEELPLYRVENQQYIHYQKGSLVFYRLRDEIGEAALNRALQRFLRDKGFQRAPFTTSAELLAYIREQTPADKQALVTDLFEKITFYDNRVLDATAVKRDDGTYAVTLKLQAEKKYADGQGKETEAPLDEEIEIGVFARGASGKESDEKPLFLERRRISEKNPVIEVVVDAEPYEAGIDPYNTFIDRVSTDNRKRVTLD